MAPSNQPQDFRFDYSKYQAPGLTVAQLDDLAKAAFNTDGNTGWVAIVWAGFKLTLALVYVWAREKMVDKQLLIEKQQYEQSQTGKNQSEVDNQEPALNKT